MSTTDVAIVEHIARILNSHRNKTLPFDMMNHQMNSLKPKQKKYIKVSFVIDFKLIPMICMNSSTCFFLLSFSEYFVGLFTARVNSRIILYFSKDEFNNNFFIFNFNAETTEEVVT